AAYSFLGFDAVSTLSEEVKNPTTTVPRGIVLVVLTGGVIFVATSFVMQWAHPSLDFADPETAGYEVLTLIGGPIFAGIINSTLLVGGVASCLAVQASGSRLLFVMGRDGVFPKRVFGRLHNRFRTPVFNLVLIAAIGLAGQLLTVGDATSLINFGAFLAFAVANACVIALWWRHPDPGFKRRSVIGFVALPVLGIIVDVYLLLNLGSLAILIGLAWLGLGGGFLAVLTRGFTRPPPGLDFAGADEA
ncbi:APC family permease, partial [Brevibacterium sp. NPDC056947]